MKCMKCNEACVDLIYNHAITGMFVLCLEIRNAVHVTHNLGVSYFKLCDLMRIETPGIGQRNHGAIVKFYLHLNF